MGILTYPTLIRLSAWLAETESSNATTYLDAATASLDFIFPRAYKIQINADFVRNYTCEPDQTVVRLRVGSRGGGVLSELGALIESISILHSITGSQVMAERCVLLEVFWRAFLTDLGYFRLQQTIQSTFNGLSSKTERPLEPQQGSSNTTAEVRITDPGGMYLLKGLAEASRRSQAVLSPDLQKTMTIILGVQVRDILFGG